MKRDLRGARELVAGLSEFLRAFRVQNDDGTLTDEPLFTEDQITLMVQQLDTFRADQHRRARDWRLDPDDPKTQEAWMLAVAGATRVLAFSNTLAIAALIDDFDRRHAFMFQVGCATILPGWKPSQLNPQP